MAVEEEYLAVLGRAVFDFASLEWGIVCLSRRLEFGFTERSYTLTAGQIGKEFRRLADQMPIADPDRADAIALGFDFSELVEVRNTLVHATPYGHGPSFRISRLSYRGRHGEKYWAAEDIRTAAASFQAASSRANELLYRQGFQARPW